MAIKSWLKYFPWEAEKALTKLIKIDNSFDPERMAAFISKYDLGDETEEIKLSCLRLVPHFELTPRERTSIADWTTKAVKSSYREYLDDLQTLKSVSDEKLVLRFNIDVEALNGEIDKVSHSLKSDKSKRYSPYSVIREYLQDIFASFSNTGLKVSEQIDFVFDLFKKFELDDFGKGIDNYVEVEGKRTRVEDIQRRRIKRLRQQIIKGII
jgi:hypothetical protein|tara:strand:+ start:109 stop:741 length:633 start_codon:yes stop_codon:yes gene_type:complete